MCLQKPRLTWQLHTCGMRVRLHCHLNEPEVVFVGKEEEEGGKKRALEENRRDREPKGSSLFPSFCLSLSLCTTAGVKATSGK